MSQTFVDDAYTHLESDILKIRTKYRMYISYSNKAAARAIVTEVLFNALDEARNPRSPANKIDIEYDERTDTIKISDNGRGIPTDILELVLTTLNSGSNIDSGSKSDLQTNTLGRNGVGTLATTALGEVTEVTSYRGGTENKFKRLLFHEGKKIEEETKSCDASKHGLVVLFKPSKILGKNTKIDWDEIHNDLINLQFLIDSKIKMTSIYTDIDGNPHKEDYKIQPFESILLKNGKDSLISDRIKVSFEDRNVIEEVGGKRFKRFISVNMAFCYTNNNQSQYIDSFCNSNNTIDFGSHYDGVLEGLCRYFQQVTKNSLSEREKLDIKWDDVKTGLSLVVSLDTNMEDIFTGQTKHKVSSEDLEKLIKDESIIALQEYFDEKGSHLKELINIIKTNARARREGDKARSAVVKETMTNWSSFKMKNYDPCTNKGKEYKELYIIEGDSAKGSLKLSRNPKFQALFAIRGVSANVFKLDLNGVLANKEFNDLIKVMGCNVGAKFDMSRLQFNKIIIASDADVDGLFIRSLLCSFFIKVFPEIIEDGRLFIAEPPLYRVDDKKDPFVINKEDYIKRYINGVLKEYKVAYDNSGTLEYLDKGQLKDFLSESSSYVDDILMLSQHYKINDRLIEIIIEEFSSIYQGDNSIPHMIENLNIQKMMTRIGEEFNELYYDDRDALIKGVIDGKYQSLEISDRLVRKSVPLITITKRNGPALGKSLILKNIKTGSENSLSLLGLLKILKKFQPDILHRFKGLGESTPQDLSLTILDPNTRTLLRVQISDIENDMKVFQVLRGNSPQDAANRKEMMRQFKIDRSLIDT